MLDSIIYFLLKYTFVFTAVLFVVKFLLFIRHKNKHWTIIDFFYFNEINIKFTQNVERVRLKKIQNSLSITILVLLILQFFTTLLL